MKTTDSVMREFDEKFIILPNPKYGRPYLWKDSSYILNGENDGEHAQIINIRAFLSHSLAEARREWVEEMVKVVSDEQVKEIELIAKNPISKSVDSSARASATRIVLKILKSDLLTGDNPEEAKEKITY